MVLELINKYSNGVKYPTYDQTQAQDQSVVVTMGEQGVLWVGCTAVLTREMNKFNHNTTFNSVALSTYQKALSNNALTVVNDEVSVLHLPAMPISNSDIINTSGAGDTFCGTLIHGLTTQELSIPLLIKGLSASRECLLMESAIPTHLKELLLELQE